MESLGSNPQVGANSVNPSDPCSSSGSQAILTDPSSPDNPSVGDPFAPCQSDVSFMPGSFTSPTHYIAGVSDTHTVPYASELRNPPANAGHRIEGGSEPHIASYSSQPQHWPAKAGHYSDYSVGGSYPSEQHDPQADAIHSVVGSSDLHATDESDLSGLTDPHGSSSPSISSHRAIAVRMPSWTSSDAPADGVTGQNLIPFLSYGAYGRRPL
ncbi:hypothetical protein M413DRAFT_447484 [Hebeloma cylindrosporum]|uniref:Uncharacterized protein n=1 Tax=Hebeloma cylindrosporum TaxID=76867 RepID=A0A0C3BR81_HEBCY|nr:hypothetical protein M413DRAFT_447484 [Hebeloma cylindrosporum h7]